MKIHGFPKRERIVSQKLIDELFGGGQSHTLVAFPLRAVFKLHPSGREVPHDELSAAASANDAGESRQQLLISVPKRQLRHAVDRNRVKRQLREGYRHHRQLLAEGCQEGQTLLIALVWLTDRMLPTAEVEKRVEQLLKRIVKKLTPNTVTP